MKQYKLIHKTTQEEHICSKVVIDGFDYYVTDSFCKNKEWFYVPFTNKLEQYNENINYGEFHPHKTFWKTLIATNNPNIDLPQVINEVEELAMSIVDRNTGTQSQNTFNRYKFFVKKGYNKSQETHSNSDDDICNVIEWMQKPAHLIGINDKGTIKTTKELFEIWKEQQIKIIYYK